MTTLFQREFTVADEYTYNRQTPARWVLAHVWRYPWLPIVFVTTVIGMAVAQSFGAVFIGRAFDVLLNGGNAADLGVAALWVASAYLGYGACDIVNSLALRVLGQRVERDARDEMYVSLLGKSQTFLGRQRVGDLMARATNDVAQVTQMVAPNAGLILESFFALVVPLVTITLLRADLLLVPVLFLASFGVAIRRYSRALEPVSEAMSTRFGLMNAGLAEAIGGIEVVKGYAQEPQEERKFAARATAFRDAFVQSGVVQARYLPLLLFGIAIGLAFGHAVLLVLRDELTVGQAITYMALIDTLRTPTYFSLTTFAAVQLGMSSAVRLLDLISAKTELDENTGGHTAPMRGEIEFCGVSFGYGGPSPKSQASSPILHNISFHARPGETIAIVGQTGSGKSTLTKLVNRIFDATEGQVVIDGVDVREWSLDSLRSQIATIEQDVFLFSRSIGENIAFGARGEVTQSQIEHAAREAQAHDFILSLPDGYDTVVGERGMTLSGGQRQRIAIARAFLSDPRILILDDSTSAIDSATEDEIQKAMRRILSNRTTLLITHRIAQIRQADRILLLKNGELLASGTHSELLASSAVYQRIFARA